MDDLVALRACDAVQGMRHADGKRRALDRVSRLLRLWPLPARGTKVIRWPGLAAGCTAASALEEVRARLTGKGRRLWHWVKRRTRVVLPQCRTYASQWNHIRCSRASGMLALLATGEAEHPPRPEAQTGMVRMKRYWKLQVAVSPAQALRQGRGEVNKWARKCFGASFRCPGRPRADPRGRSHAAAGAAPSHHGPGPSDELADHRSHLTSPADGEVLVQECKDKPAAWRMPAQVYLHWVAHLPVADGIHWRRVGSSVHEVSALYHHLHRELLPLRFAYMASAHRWAGFGLNYMYINLKAKCFTHLEGRTCEKPGHSCLHKVVSWCSHPAVDYYRWLARGAQTLVAAWGKGHDVSSLKTAATELRSKVAVLSGPAADGQPGREGQAPGAACCARCGAHMPCPAVVVADAAQMYEEVPPSRVRSGLRSLFAWTAGRGYTGVAVCKRTAWPSFLVRQRWRHPPGTVLFTWDELGQGLRRPGPCPERCLSW